jgi:uncharacterized protein involved in exopolysaccharide biosynthesis
MAKTKLWSKAEDRRRIAELKRWLATGRGTKLTPAMKEARRLIREHEVLRRRYEAALKERKKLEAVVRRSQKHPVGRRVKAKGK